VTVVHSDRIKPDDCSILTYLDNLRGKKYQIPTFQREVVWDRNSVKKLWDSIYRFYPIGSILIWKTELELQDHRSIGGHVVADGSAKDGFQYILDGQQRTTSLLTSLYGGRIEGRGDFDPTLYIDLTIDDTDDADDESHKERFLFWDEIDDSGGKNIRNTAKAKRFEKGVIIKLRDVIENLGDVERRLVDGEHSDYDDPVRERLRGIRDVLDKYRLSLIELRGIEVSEVCEIFERINQEGKPLDIFDIVVAKTFRVKTEAQPGFYLRDLIEGFRHETGGNFAAIDDLVYLQILAMIINQNIPDSGIPNITNRYLNRVKTEQIEAVWHETATAIRKMFDFFDNHLHLKGPRLIPYGYFYVTIGSHFYKNREPDYDFLKQYFWYHGFHSEDLLTNTTHVRQQVDLLKEARTPGRASLKRFLIDRNRLRTASYSTRGRLSTAILCLLANQEPRDWANPDRHVLTDVYYVLTDRPNLHHVFPTGYLEKEPGVNELDSDSLMNIAYLTQLTNIQISDKNPLEYVREYDSSRFDEVLATHLISSELLEWARQEDMPKNGLDRFIEARVDLMIDNLKEKLAGVPFDVIDTREDRGNA
jgi:hypothetical protein